MTEARSRSQMNLYSILAMNLFMTGNLSALSAWQIETWSNAEVISVNRKETVLLTTMPSADVARVLQKTTHTSRTHA